MTDSCTLKFLPLDMRAEGARRAVEQNPTNRRNVAELHGEHPPLPELLAVLVGKYWGHGGTKLTVSFLDSPPADLRARILGHMNAWHQWANVQFVETGGQGQVRISRTPGGGYWSYLGTDILSIPTGQPTMNLDSFSMGTPESEYLRVVRHETGHTLGCPHEHMRRELVARLDPEKTIAYFGAHYGWDRRTVVQQVLTPVEESALLGTPHADSDSIMCYMLPGAITLDGQPIGGGVDIDQEDREFIAGVYPLAVQPPPPPPVGSVLTTVQGLDARGGVLWTAKPV